MPDPQSKPKPPTWWQMLRGITEAPAVPSGPLQQAPEIPGGFSIGDLVRGATIGAEWTGDTPWAYAGEAAGLLPLGGLMKAGRGLYSRVDDALRLLPKSAHPNKVASILKSNASAEELTLRKVPEFLAGKGNTPVTPADLQAHLAQHPAPMPSTKTLGAPPAELVQAQDALGQQADLYRKAAFDDPADWVGVSQRDRMNARVWAYEAAAGDTKALAKLQEVVVDPDHLQTILHYGDLANQSSVLNERRLAEFPSPKFAQYTLPGGEQYRETLLTLPGTESPRLAAIRAELEELTALPAKATTYKGEDRTAAFDRLKAEFNALGGTPHRPEGFRSGHFDEPNIVAHTRSNVRTLPTGERGRFIEEVQSDWHQQGKKRGYKSDAEDKFKSIKAELEQKYGHDIIDIRGGKVPWSHALDEDLRRMDDAYRIVQDETHGRMVVPDAPFKETWPDLGLKQQLLEAAADPDAQWLGFTSGQTQAARYDLSKQIDSLAWRKNASGDITITGLKDGRDIYAGDHKAAALRDVIGDEMAEKIINDPQQVGEYTGEALKAGGTGMRVFYDKLLPKRLEKIVKPFGGKVERVPLTGGRTREVIDAEMDTLMQHEATMPQRRFMEEYNRLQEERNLAMGGAGGDQGWIVRLTPEMKQRILKEGLPLMMIPLAGLAATGAGPSETR